MLVDSEPINRPSSSSSSSCHSPSLGRSCYRLQPSLAPPFFACWLDPRPSTSPPRPDFRRASVAAATAIFLGVPLLRLLVDSEPVNRPSSHSSSSCLSSGLFCGCYSKNLGLRAAPPHSSTCSTSGRPSIVFFATAIRRGTLASAPPRPALRAAGPPLSSSRLLSDIGPWHPRHRGLLNERQALLRLLQDCHPTWHPGIRAIAACSTSGRPSFVFFKTAIRHRTLASAPPRPAQRAAGPPSSSSRLLSDMAPWRPRRRGLLNERQALLRLLQDCHPTWHPGIRAIAACSTSGRPSFVFFDTAIRHGTLASAPSRPAQRAAGPPSSSSRLPSDMAPWHPRRRGLLNERQALLRLQTAVRHGILGLWAAPPSSFACSASSRHHCLRVAPSRPLLSVLGRHSGHNLPPFHLQPPTTTSTWDSHG